jgi:hypothetical protein
MMNWKNAPYYPFTHTANWTTMADITPSQEVNNPCLPANSLPTGTMLKVHAWGIVGSAAGTATSIMGLYLNGSAAGTAIATSASYTPATATVQLWQADFWITILTEGSSGTLQCGGQLIGVSATPATALLVPATQPAAATINTTVANGISLGASWGTGATGNLYTVDGFVVVQYN